MKIRSFLPLAFLAFSGCLSSQGFNPMTNQSQVALDGNDFRVVNTVRGEASVAYLFGIIPLGDPGLATRATDELVASAETVGKARALTNWAFDRSTGFYFFVTTQTVKLRADVIEFR